MHLCTLCQGDVSSLLLSPLHPSPALLPHLQLLYSLPTSAFSRQAAAPLQKLPPPSLLVPCWQCLPLLNTASVWVWCLFLKTSYEGDYQCKRCHFQWTGLNNLSCLFFCTTKLLAQLSGRFLWFWFTHVHSVSYTSRQKILREILVLKTLPNLFAQDTDCPAGKNGARYPMFNEPQAQGCAVMIHSSRIMCVWKTTEQQNTTILAYGWGDRPLESLWWKITYIKFSQWRWKVPRIENILIEFLNQSREPHQGVFWTLPPAVYILCLLELGTCAVHSRLFVVRFSLQTTHKLNTLYTHNTWVVWSKTSTKTKKSQKKVNREHTGSQL